MNLDKFFNPKTIAVIGVSSNERKIGRVVYDTLLQARKQVYAVNPNAELISGTKCYPNLSEVGKVDLIVVAVPVKETLKVMEEAGKLGIKNAVLITAGFKEVGNNKDDKELENICSKYQINIIGPNCLGILDSYSGVDCVFLPPNKLKRPEKGGISFITQSGATGSAILDVLGDIGVSKFISYGNALNLNECDYLEYLGKDKSTKIICMYIEGVKDGKRFLKVCKNIRKPIVVLKGGKTNEGKKATLSHTGSLAGDEVIYSGIFKQLGLYEVNGIREMIGVLKLLKSKMTGDTIGVITNGGGYGILSVDHLVNAGLHFNSKLVDLFGDASTEGYKKAINAMREDIILCNVLFQTPLVDEGMIDVLAKASKYKNIVVVSTGSEYTDKIKHILAGKNVCVFDTPEEAVDALRIVIKHE